MNTTSEINTGVNTLSSNTHSTMNANDSTALLNVAAYVRYETIISGNQAAQLDNLTDAINDLTAIVERDTAKIAERLANGLSVEMLERMTDRYKAKLSDVIASLRAWLVDFKNNRPNVQINIDAPESESTTTTDEHTEQMGKTTQKEIKRLIKSGAAIELTDTKTVPAGRLETVAKSYGIYGMNGGLFRDIETGQLYGIPRRDGILFFYC